MFATGASGVTGSAIGAHGPAAAGHSAEAVHFADAATAGDSSAGSGGSGAGDCDLLTTVSVRCMSPLASSSGTWAPSTGAPASSTADGSGEGCGAGSPGAPTSARGSDTGLCAAGSDALGARSQTSSDAAFPAAAPVPEIFSRNITRGLNPHACASGSCDWARETLVPVPSLLPSDCLRDTPSATASSSPGAAVSCPLPVLTIPLAAPSKSGCAAPAVDRGEADRLLAGVVDREDAAAEGLGERGFCFMLRALARLVHHDTTSDVCWGLRRFVRA